MRRLIQTVEESLRAPGLPYPPCRRSRLQQCHAVIEVSSVNYDYLPMAIDSPKVFWVDLVRPAPDDLSVGALAKLHIAPNRGIRTELSADDPNNSTFEVTDIIGSRVILSPYKGSAWLPTVHQACDNPFGWGYDLRVANVGPNMHNNKYGYGAPVGMLEYSPAFY